MTDPSPNQSHRVKPYVLVPLLATPLLLVLLFGSTVQHWWGIWASPGYYYSIAIYTPLFVVLYAWTRREQLRNTPWRPSFGGVLLLLAGLMLYLAGIRLDIVAIQSFAFLITIMGMACILLGGPRTRLLAVPIMFIGLAIPIVPDQFTEPIARVIELQSCRVAAIVLNAIQLHAEWLGPTLRLDAYTTAPEPTVGGYYTVYSMIAIALALVMLMDGRKARRGVLAVIAIPLALLLNMLRTVVDGVVGELGSPDVALFLHNYSSLVAVAVNAFVVMTLADRLECGSLLGESQVGDTQRHPVVTGVARLATCLRESAVWLASWHPIAQALKPTMAFIIVLDLLMCAGLAIRSSIMRPRQMLPPIATYQVPAQFVYDGVTYTSKTHSQDPSADRISKRDAEILQPVRVISRVYRGTDGSETELFITSGSGRTTFHDPHACMRGANAPMTDIGRPVIQTPDGPVQVQETTYQAMGMPLPNRIWYCYAVDGKVLQDARQIRVSIMHKMLSPDTGKPSYFIRITPTTLGVPDIRRAQLNHFLAGMWHEIGPILLGERVGRPDPSPIVNP